MLDELYESKYKEYKVKRKVFRSSNPTSDEDENEEILDGEELLIDEA